MRRIVLLLSAFMFLGVIVVNAQTKKGDLNGDGYIDKDDVLCLVYKVLGFDEGTDDYDVNEDGTVDITDVTSLVSIIVSNQQAEPLQTCPDDNHPHIIDLGLPSGTKWACCNVGASSPEKCGYYYAWGETEEKDWYLRKTYIYYDADEDKYIDLGDIRGTEYDAAHLKWGGAWRMPTWEESEEIFDLVRRQQYVNGIKMEVFVGPNGNSIQVPYTDCQWALYKQELESEWPMFWTSILNDSKIYAYKGGGSHIRYAGLPIRPVYDPSFFFSLSEGTVDMFVNSTTSVTIEMGSGEYELQYDQTDIIDAELIMADKEEYPDAKDEISIYGVAEGTAQLKVVDKKNNKAITIDVNVKTPTDEDLATTSDYVERVRNYINSQKELEIYTFQNNLISWLEEQSWVKNVNVDYDHDIVLNTSQNGVKRIIQEQMGRVELIAITFENSSTFSVLFYDMALCDDDGYIGNLDLQSYLLSDISSVGGEEIIDNANVLHLQCREMPSFKENKLLSTEFEEISLIDQCISLSPVNFKLTRYSYRTNILSFLDENLSNYGMILLGQTHGCKKGMFQIEADASRINCGITLAVKDGTLIPHHKEPIIYWVSKEAVSKLKISKNTIFHGCFCHSYNLEIEKVIPQNITYYGYTTSAGYQRGSLYMTEFFCNMSHGLTYNNAIDNMLKPYYHNDLFVIPETNRRYSKQRYFSISTDEVKYSETGTPIIKGQIKGYHNLKPDILYYIYAYSKNEEFSYADIATKGKLINYEANNGEGIYEDGSFSFEYKDLPITQTPEEYNVIVGFFYGGINYYGPIKTLVTKSLCPDEHHPHIIDLGLSSGTKWACCNVGASTPKQYGDYYSWGETTGTKSVYKWNTYLYGSNYNNVKNIGNDIAGTKYDAATAIFGAPWRMPSLNLIKELINNTATKWITIDGVNGRIFTGYNGNTIFLPAAGDHWDDGLLRDGEYGGYWSSIPGGDYPGNARGFNFESGYVRLGYYYRYGGRTIRPVR